MCRRTDPVEAAAMFGYATLAATSTEPVDRSPIRALVRLFLESMT